MIEINLLPEELRVREKPITGMRLVLFLGIPFLCVLVYFWVWLHFFKYTQAEDELQDLSSRAKELKQQAEEVKKLDAQLNKMKTKGKTIKKLKGLQRVDWIEKLMQLTDVIRPTQGWLTSVKFRMSGGKGSIDIGCAIKGRDKTDLRKNVKEFLNHLGYRNGNREAAVESDFWKEFISQTPDYYYKGITEIKTVGAWKLTNFTLRLEIKPEVVSSINVEGI